jgi:hypothetical protein
MRGSKIIKRSILHFTASRSLFLCSDKMNDRCWEKIYRRIMDYKKKCRMGVCSDKLMCKVVTLDCIFALK